MTTTDSSRQYASSRREGRGQLFGCSQNDRPGETPAAGREESGRHDRFRLLHRRWEKRARETLKDYHYIDAQYVSGLTLEGFKQKAKQLPSDVILVILTVFQDAEGRKVCPPRGGDGDRGGIPGSAGLWRLRLLHWRGRARRIRRNIRVHGAEHGHANGSVSRRRNPTPQIIRSKAAPLVDWRQMKRWEHPRREASDNVSCDFTSRRPGTYRWMILGRPGLEHSAPDGHDRRA